MKPNDKAIEAALSVTLLHGPRMQEYMRRILTAAFAAQFPPSEDYAGLVKWLRDKAESLSEIYPPEAEAADALEALLAERDIYKNWLDNYEKQFAAKVEELVTVRLERDALLARLAPVDDEALEEKAAAAIIAVEHNGIDDEFILEARAVIAAIRPHIEAAERERCAKIVEDQYYLMKNKQYISPEWMNGYVSSARDIAAAIRSGK